LSKPKPGNSNDNISYSGAPVSGRMLKLLLTDGESIFFSSERERERERQEKKGNEKKKTPFDAKRENEKKNSDLYEMKKKRNPS
jgi:hypothetical protein